MKRFLIIAMAAVCIQSAPGQSTIAYFSGPSFQITDIAFQPLDINGDGTPDFHFWLFGPLCYGSPEGPPGYCSWSYLVAGSETSEFLKTGGSYSYALAQSFGSGIGSGSLSNGNWSGLGAYAGLATQWWHGSGQIINGQLVYSGWDGPLGTLTNGYLGVRFQAQDGLHYGWIHFTLQGSPLLVDWAYETRPNTAIIAGAKPVAVPQAAPEIVRPGQFRLKWQSEIGKAYQVQSKENLAAPLWTNLAFIIVGTATNAAVDIPMTGTATFFRVVEAD